MARKSVDFSHSLLKFQANGNSNSNSNSNGGPRTSKSRLSLNVSGAKLSTTTTATTTGTKPTTKSIEVYQDKDLDKEKDKYKHKHKDKDEIPIHDTINEVEILKTKYSIQTQSLTKANNVLSKKITEMEGKISELMNENMTLCKNQNSQEIEVKKVLDRKLMQVENQLIDKFDEIFKILKAFRESEQLDIHPMTSTPERRGPYQSLLDIHMPILRPEETNNDVVDKDPERRKDISTIVEDHESSEVDIIQVEQAEQVQQPSTESQSVPQPQPNQNTEPHQQTDAASQPQPQQEFEKKEDLQTKNEIRRRSSRSRGEVNYKPLSLRGKMRRESTHFVDAVDENAFINYTVPAKKSENSRKRQTLGNSESGISKRRPLNNITHTSNTNIDVTSNKDNLSVFDFPTTQSTYVGKRSKNKRRYTTFTQ
ncbi:uncharacterized protein RJT21DRAFT_6481 [Scheffersomyces amazonensis]|uniref:uncharacterized protein n=1 Tax=Scheffersomyces amazonensis TaxID=1078765 RepID=UPI00315CE6C1